METVKPLTWEEAKDKIAFKHGGHSSWIEMRRFFDSQSPYLIEQRLGEAAELYASSRVRALEEEIESVKKINDTRQVEINLDALSCAVADAEEEIEQRLKKEQNEELLNALRRVASLEEENKRLQERLEAADACIQVWSWHADLNMTILEWRDACRTRLAKYNSLKPVTPKEK